MKACSQFKKQLEFKKKSFLKRYLYLLNNSALQPIRSSFYASGDEKSKSRPYLLNLDPAFWRPKRESKEIIQHFKKCTVIYSLLYFCGSFLPFWIRIRIQGPHWIQIQSRSGSRTLVFKIKIKYKTRAVQTKLQNPSSTYLSDHLPCVIFAFCFHV